jgi:tetratricopeptide (TPR) repeat protein
VRDTHPLRRHCWLLSIILLLVSWQADAASRVLDRIEIHAEGDQNVISVHFNIPVRYVSHVMNDAGNEVGIQLQIIQTRDVSLEDLVQSDQLSWKPSAEIPLDKVVFQGVRLGTSNLLVSFVTPVKNFKIRQSRDFRVMDFLLKKRPALVNVPKPPVSMINVDVPETKSPFNFKALPLTIYVINLSSKLTPIDLDKVAPVTVNADQALYTTTALVDGREWNRLRLGYFRTKQQAESKLKTVKNLYPEAWIDRADLEERRQAMFKLGLAPPTETAAGTAKGPTAPQTGEQKQPETRAEPAPVEERLTNMMETIRRTMTAGEYDKAIRMLQAMLEEPENYYTKEAMEMMGLARERNGQTAHAKAQYEAFLKKYPKGEDAERVKQRLQGLITAAQALREPLRKEEEEKPVEWETYGSLSQDYRRDSVDNPGSKNDLVSASEIDTFFDVNSRRRGKDVDLQMKLSGSYTNDLLSGGPGNDSTLSEAYVDLEHRDTQSSMRLGRQRLNSSGILNRFDGLVLGYELTPDLRIKAAAGLPVESFGDTSLNKHKHFVGLSSDISNILENWDASLYFIDQRVDDLIDRRAVGGELRYFDSNKSLFGLLDYDIHYGTLNIFSLQGNWTLDDQTRLYMNLDYRKSPLLLTSNALRSYFDPDLYGLSTQVFQPVESIQDLLKFETADAIFTRAQALTADNRTLLLGVSRPLSDTLQISGDVTITSTGGTPQLGVAGTDNIPQSNDFVAAVPDTGTQFYYNLQVIKNDLLKQGDIGILSLRYYDTDTSNTYRMGVSSRYPINSIWRINPRFDLSYRTNKDNDNTQLVVSPYLRMEYRLRKSFTLELESGLSWYQDKNSQETSKQTDYFFLAGYRWDF